MLPRNRKRGRFLYYFLARAGPYSGFDKSGKNRELVDLAVECFPTGLPCHAENWPQPEDVGIERFSLFLSKVLIRSPPECLTNRWYSADIASWFYLMQWKLSAFGHYIPQNSRISWWPGMSETSGQTVCRHQCNVLANVQARKKS